MARGLRPYVVLKGRVLDVRAGLGSSPHLHVLVAGGGDPYRVAVNARSQDGSMVEYLVRPGFRHRIVQRLQALAPGLHRGESRPGGLALDYVRDELMAPHEMQPLPVDLPGPDNDLNEKLGQLLERARADENAFIHAFGESWGPEPRRRDKYFGFLPGRGIHNIHMNQGNPPGGDFHRDNGVHQDGGLLLAFPREEEWIAVFLKFRNQAWRTDDRTGDVAAPRRRPARRARA